jgi:hypothetical protein
MPQIATSADLHSGDKIYATKVSVCLCVCVFQLVSLVPSMLHFGHLTLIDSVMYDYISEHQWSSFWFRFVGTSISFHFGFH